MASEASQIGDMLKAERERAGMTQEEAAQVAGVTVTTVGRWERGERTPSAAVVKVLRDAYSAHGAGSRVAEVSRETVGTYRLTESPEPPDAIWNREHEIEEELRKAGATPQQIRDFRKSVRESSLVTSLFHKGAPKKTVSEMEMNLYEGVAMAFAAIVRQQIREEKEAKRRS